MIINKTKNKTISKQEKRCKSLFSQAIGLMFHHKQNLVMEFPKQRSISLHNCFVFFPIDVLILDEKMKIVEIKLNFKPFTFWNATQKGKYVIELGDRNKEYEIGDKVEISTPYIS
jgi:uncharacterized membrane protein (UPF0127 family)